MDGGAIGEITMIYQIEPYHEWFLRSVLHTQDVPHSGRSLYDHLLGTHHLLCRWSMSKMVRYAGLFHSVYGTNAFSEACLKRDRPEERSLLATVIGERAEDLVYLFCTIDRPGCLLAPAHFPATAYDEGERKNLLAIEVANLLEQGGNEKTLNVMLDKCYHSMPSKPREAINQALRRQLKKASVAEAE